MTVEVKVLTAAGKASYAQSQTIASATDTLLHFANVIKGVQPWNAEQPYLYTLVINTTDKNGRVQESVAQPFGFRTVEL